MMRSKLILIILWLALLAPVSFSAAVAEDEAGETSDKKPTEEAPGGGGIENASGSGPGHSESGLPIPRFVAFRFEEVNVRAGPGTRYPIRWVYKRKGLPAEVVQEFGYWRQVRDIDGDEGWVHKSQLVGKRSAILTEDSTLYRSPEKGASPLIKAQKDVVGYVLECDTDWCQMQIDSFKAWIPKTHIWGVYPKEIL